MQFDSASKALIELAASRHNAFLTSEAADINFPIRRLRYAENRGEIRRLYPKVWSVTSLPGGAFQRLRAAVLTRNKSAASLLSAAWLHGWIESPPARPQIWIPAKASRLTGVTTQRFSLDDPEKNVLTVNWVRTLNKAATLCLLGAVCSDDVVERCLDEFLRTESERWLARTLARLYTAKTSGPHALQRVMNNPARAVGVPDSHLERVTAQLLAQPGLPPLVLQHEVEVEGRRFRMDMAFPDLLLGIEFHSRTYHHGRVKAEADNERDLLIGSLGWKLLYVTYTQLQNPDELVRLVRLNARARAKQLLGK